MACDPNDVTLYCVLVGCILKYQRAEFRFSEHARGKETELRLFRELERDDEISAICFPFPNLKHNMYVVITDYYVATECN